MSHITVITPTMHKIAEFNVDVKYRRPGNVVEYKPVEFEIFGDGECFKAIPLVDPECKRLTNIPGKFVFKIKEGALYIFGTGFEEIVDDIVNKLTKLKLLEPPLKKVYSREMTL